MMAGLMSVKACAMIAGLGTRVRKKMWQPWQNSNKNSNDMPYICAIGKMLTVFEPLSMCGPILCIVKSRLPHNAR